MTMVVDKHLGRAVVQERVKGWKGITFPGGHVEPGESIVESAAREILEETGLAVTNLVHCGVVDWYNDQTGERYLVFLYKTHDFAGELISSDEGRVFWTDIASLSVLPLAEHFERYIDLFSRTDASELFAIWRNGEEGWKKKPLRLI